jgi:hypothetical protein
VSHRKGAAVAKSEKRKIVIRYSDNVKTRRRRILYALFRFLFYGMIGVFAEVCFYSLIKIGRLIPGISWIFRFKWGVDSCLGLDNIWNAPIYTFFGQCSLWMFLVYAICALFIIERIYRRIYRIFWVIRGVLYAFSILIFELISGFLLFRITGFKIWFYSDPLNLFQMTSLYILPIWFITGTLVELIYRELMENEIHSAIQKEIDELAAR